MSHLLQNDFIISKKLCVNSRFEQIKTIEQETPLRQALTLHISLKAAYKLKNNINHMRIKKTIGELVLQIIPVMIGVYLGFVVSNWSSNKQQDLKKKILIENIIVEVKDNQTNINSVVRYHEMLRDSSRHFLKLNKSEIPSFFRGVNTLTLSNSAFETGVQTGLLNELSIDKIQSLNRVYTSQKSYDEFCNILLSGLINMDFMENEESMKKILQYLSISMTDVAIKERQLLRDYQNVLDNILTEK